MKKLVTLLVLLVSNVVNSQNRFDTTVHQPMFYGLNVYAKDKVSARLAKEKNNAYQYLLNEWYKENIDKVYGEFIRLLNEERSHLRTNKRLVICKDLVDFKNPHFSNDSVVLIEDWGLAKKLSKEFQRTHNVTLVDNYTTPSGHKRITIAYISPMDQIKYDSLSSVACLHHNKYLINESNYLSKDWARRDSIIFLLGHNESRPVYPYHDTVINSAGDRVRHYTKGKGDFMGEIFASGYVLNNFKCDFEEKIDPTSKTQYSVMTKVTNNPYKEIAKSLFEQFKKSKKHHEIMIQDENFGLIGMNLLHTTTNKFYFTVVMVKEKK
jgi:hypothetical protein